MEDKKLNAYRHLLQQVREAMGNLGQRLEPVLGKTVDQAAEQGSQWAELGREELDHLADYLKRDVVDVSLYLQKFGSDLQQWLDFETNQAEVALLDDLLQVADQTTVELDRLRLEADLQPWRTGEVIGVGALRCTGCGEVLHFQAPGHIPPCPKCRGNEYHKFWQ